MREVSFVNKLKFNFPGSVTKRALVIGDADNDQRNELVCANLQGDLAIFKDKNSDKYAYASDLGMVTACIVGDVINAHKNYVAAINTEGWLFIFDVPRSSAGDSVSRNVSPDQAHEASSRPKDQQGARSGGTQQPPAIKLNLTYDQRMPANCKDLLLADLDGDGQNELIVGLTDRVLRTYKWITIGTNRGKFVGLYKWEFADQIGSVSLNPSRHENCQDIIVAQPGGTYAKLECFDKKLTVSQTSGTNSNNQTPPDSLARLSQEGETVTNQQPPSTQQLSEVATNDDSDNVRTEYISKLTPEYHQLALAQMRNHHISTEVLGSIRDKENPDSHSLIVIATLDGTLMLVNKDEILWSIQVDHQLFALAMLESTKTPEMAGCGRGDSGGGGTSNAEPKLSQSESTCTIVPNTKFDTRQHPSGSSINQASGDNVVTISASARRRSSQYFAVCAWNGKTYIIDEERNYLRFKFDEAVSAFTAGNYYFDGSHHSALVYATFNNQIILYYDILQNQIRPMYLLNEIFTNPLHADLLRKLRTLNRRVRQEVDDDNGVDDASDHHQLQDLLHGLLYAVTDRELGISP